MKTQVSSLLCGFFLLNFIYYSIGQPSWTRITPLPQEHTINCITQIPGSEKLVCVTSGSSVMISEDAGNTWEVILNPAGQENNFYSKGVYFFNENIGFIYGGNEKILRTSNGGYNWQLVYDGNAFYYWQTINDIEFVNLSTGFAIASSGKFFKTTDSGQSWEQIATGMTFNLLVLEFADPENGFIFTSGDQFLKTSNGGETWDVETLPAPIAWLSFEDVYFTSSTSAVAIGSKYESTTIGKIYKTDDTGESWTEVYSDGNGWYWPSSVDFYDENHGMVAFNTIMYGVVCFRTIDGGDTWEETPMFYVSPINTLYYSAEKALVSGLFGTIAQSVDNGDSWEITSERSFTLEIDDVQFIDDQLGYASAYGGGGGVAVFDLFKTTNGGDDWSHIYFFMSPGCFHFINENTGFFTTNDIGLTVYKTINGGLDWTEIASGTYELEPTCIRFYDEMNGLICEENLIKTSDGGLNWQVINLGVGHEVNTIQYLDENIVFITGKNYQGTFIYKSYDGGNEWLTKFQSDSNLHGTDLFFKNESTGYLTAKNSILKTTDAGENWEIITIDLEHEIWFQSVHFPDEQTGYAVGHGSYETIVKTTDGGQTWNTINSSSTSGLNAVHFFDEQNGLVFGENGVVLKTETGGITGFEKQCFAAEEVDLAVCPNPFSTEIDLRVSPQINQSTAITIYNSAGNTVYHQIFPGNQNAMTLNLSRLEPGIYFLNMNTEGIAVTKKIIKIK
jgi:photosystem II stability/assembly factor-like uncharacterized protein